MMRSYKNMLLEFGVNMIQIMLQNIFKSLIHAILSDEEALQKLKEAELLQEKHQKE